VYVGAWVDAGLCVPMTVKSANNAIGTILKKDVFSGRTADLHMFLGPCCKLLVVKVALVGRTSVWLCYDVTTIRRQRRQREEAQ
jgi:hypothetical protein